MAASEPSVQLLLFYSLFEFSPVSGRPEIQDEGQIRLLYLSYVKCQVVLQPGVTPFETVVEVLEPLFKGKKISLIVQRRREVAGRTLVWVTSRGDDEMELEKERRQFCDVTGETELSWREAGDPQEKNIKKEGEVFIVAGRRTVLRIYPF